MTAVLRLVPPDELDPPDASHARDPELFRPGLASARAALRAGVGRRLERHPAIDSESESDLDRHGREPDPSDGPTAAQLEARVRALAPRGDDR